MQVKDQSQIETNRRDERGRNVGRFVREIAIHETLVAVSRMLVTLSFLFF